MSNLRRAAAVMCVLLLLVGGISCAGTHPSPRAAPAASRPNIVLIFPDNLGWGEVGVYGSVRGAPTPRLDRMAAEGMRLNNFNVEFSCTVSRAAMLTGRYAARTGAAQDGGITLWEVTIPEALQPLGYATALFGKWHLGGTNWLGRRAPTDQGFDEWYGIPMTSNEAQTTTLPGYDSTKTPAPYIWEGKAGQVSKKVKPFDLATRRTIDREAAERGVAFMERNVRQRRPFFLYYAMTQIHFPTLTHPDFIGKTGAGDIGDAMAEVDHNVGLVLDAIKRLGVDDNTMVLWCADNGAEGRRPWRGTAGPWSGFYNTVMEGGIRTPCIIRWPGHIPAGQVSNDIVHEIDFFPTIAAAVGADIVPKDRAIDGVNQLPFLEGKQAHSNRESVLHFTGGTQVRAVKWHDWKLHYAFQPEPGTPVQPAMKLFNLRADPKEETDVLQANPWALSVMNKLVADFNASAERYPFVPQGAADPYVPPPAAPSIDRKALWLDPSNPEWRMPAPPVSHLRFETSKGVFVLRLVREWGPIGADRLYNLARLGYYDDTRFHRVNPNYIVQFGLHGDPTVNAAWKNQYLADDPPRSMNARGTFAFAFKAQPNTRNTQVYINLADNSRNNAEAFTVLGTVIEGMAVIDSLYSGYGETSGSGMRQGRQGPLESGGNAYMDREFPLLDRILRVTVSPGR